MPLSQKRTPPTNRIPCRWAIVSAVEADRRQLGTAREIGNDPHWAPCRCSGLSPRAQARFTGSTVSDRSSHLTVLPSATNCHGGAWPIAATAAGHEGDLVPKLLQRSNIPDPSTIRIIARTPSHVLSLDRQAVRLRASLGAVKPSARTPIATIAEIDIEPLPWRIAFFHGRRSCRLKKLFLV